MVIRPRVLFFGSPAFAVPCLREVAGRAELVGVVTQPDRPAGRGQASTPPPVKVVAQTLGVPVFQPEKVRTPETLSRLAEFRAELFIVVAYGRILPQAILDLPPLGCWNVHASLLPKLRGAAPIQWAVIRGDRETGVSIMRMEAGLDTGPVAAMRACPIADDDTAGALFERLADLGAALLADTLPIIASGRATVSPQDDAAATLAPPLTKQDGLIDFSKSARLVSAQARGVDPWPGATALLDGEPIRLFHPRVVGDERRRGEAGEVLGLGPSGLEIACGEGVVAFAELQLPGRKRLPASAVLTGRPIPPKTRLTGGVGAG